MTPEDQTALNEHVQAIAKILYRDADKSQMTNLAELEAMVRLQVQQHVAPNPGVFLSAASQAPMKGMSAR